MGRGADHWCRYREVAWSYPSAGIHSSAGDAHVESGDAHAAKHVLKAWVVPVERPRRAKAAWSAGVAGAQDQAISR